MLRALRQKTTAFAQAVRPRSAQAVYGRLSMKLLICTQAVDKNHSNLGSFTGGLGVCQILRVGQRRLEEVRIPCLLM